MASKAPPHALLLVVTSKYFAVLATMDVEIEEVQALTNPEHEIAFN